MENLFRKKSLDSLNSPENLDEFLKVTNISAWLIIAAFLIIIIGAVIWGFTNEIDGQTAIHYLFNK